MSVQVRLLICYGPLPVFCFTVSKLQFRHRVEGLRTHRFWLACARLVVVFGLFGSVANELQFCVCAGYVAYLLRSFTCVFFYGFEAAVSAPCGRVANAPFLACLFSGLCFACLRHEHGLESCCCSGVRYTGFGPRLAARVRATRNVLWIPKITGSIFSALCFPCLGHESCCCSKLSEASHKLLHGIRRCGKLVSCFMDSKGNGNHFCWLVFCMPWARSLLLFEAFGSFA